MLWRLSLCMTTDHLLCSTGHIIPWSAFLSHLGTFSLTSHRTFIKPLMIFVIKSNLTKLHYMVLLFHIHECNDNSSEKASVVNIRGHILSWWAGERVTKHWLFEKKVSVKWIRLESSPSLKSCLRYCLVTSTWKTVNWQMKAANLVKLCLPEPPIPTSNMFPLCWLITRTTRVTEGRESTFIITIMHEC